MSCCGSHYRGKELKKGKSNTFPWADFFAFWNKTGNKAYFCRVFLSHPKKEEEYGDDDLSPAM